MSSKCEGEVLVLCSKAVRQAKAPELLLFPCDETPRFIDNRLNCVCRVLQAAGNKRDPQNTRNRERRD